LNEFVLDASVVVKLFLEDSGSDDAEALIASSSRLIAPDWVHVETANVIQRAVRADQLAMPSAMSALRSIPAFFDELVETIPLLSPAFELSVELGHPIYDCLYLALAVERDACLVTADQKFVAKCSSSFSQRVRPLSAI